MAWTLSLKASGESPSVYSPVPTLVSVSCLSFNPELIQNTVELKRTIEMLVKNYDSGASVLIVPSYTNNINIINI